MQLSPGCKAPLNRESLLQAANSKGSNKVYSKSIQSEQEVKYEMLLEQNLQLEFRVE